MVTSTNPKEKNWIVACVTRPIVLSFLLFLLGFILHPKWMNIRLYFGSDEPVPMNYVSNFFLWTRYNKGDPDRIVVGAADKLGHTHVRPRKTYVLIHGFTRTGLEKWIINMKNALLWREDCNVISVDWEAGSLTASYYVIQDRVPKVGEDVFQLISFLRDQTNLKGNVFHIIGHSLGAHVAGFAGKHLNGSLERVTGLDPAGLGYNGISSAYRLDKSDAHFVDVIHTHGCYTIINQWTDCYGTYENLGHADFWPNGGEQQPACGEDGDGGSKVREGSNCHHGLAYVYYTESIKYFRTSTLFLARVCSSYESYNNGSCQCPKMPQYFGYNVDSKAHGVFYLNTSKTMPYGLLDPACSAAEYSAFKIFGMIVCFLLALYGFSYSSLYVISSLVKIDLLEMIKAKLDSTSFNGFAFFDKKSNIN